MKYAVLFLLLLPSAYADIVISQVLYDPIGTESGGEAVELRNTGNVPVDVSGWVLATESSIADAKLPPGTIVGPGQTFLIADEGWDANKDNPEWKSADYEEKITLGNKDSGVAIVHNGTVIDAVGWGNAEGIDDGLFEGTPAVPVATGKALLRMSDSDDNAEDFVEAVADFQEGIPVPVTANVVVSVPMIEISKSLDLKPEGILSIKNNGASPVAIKLLFNDFYFQNYTIPKSAVEVDEDEFTVPPFMEHKSKVRLRIPENAVPGSYASTLRVIITYGS